PGPPRSSAWCRSRSWSAGGDLLLSILVEILAAHVVAQIAGAVRAPVALGLLVLALRALDLALGLKAGLQRVGSLGEIGRGLAVLLVRGLAAFALVLLVGHAQKLRTYGRTRSTGLSFQL